MNGRRTIASACVLAALSALASAQGTNADQVEAGRKLYINACQRCHGINLSANGIGFDLRTFSPHDKERFVRSVTNGIRAMPAWGNALKPEQMDQIWAYIGSVNAWKVTPGSP
jgi:mono/diheme cytochrome c family protein